MSSSSSNSPKLKLLITGPVLGQFAALATKLAQLQKSRAGPFDVCFCCGPFFDCVAGIGGGGADGGAGGGAGGGGAGGDKGTDKVEGTLDHHAEQHAHLQAQALSLLSLPDDCGRSPHSASSSSSSSGSSSGRIEMPLPVIFVDVGRLPEGVALPDAPEAGKVKDEDEIDLDDDDELDDAEDEAQKGAEDAGASRDAAAGKTDNGTHYESKGAKDSTMSTAATTDTTIQLPPGIIQIAHNVYRLYGTTGPSGQPTADIVNLPLPPESYVPPPPKKAEPKAKDEAEGAKTNGDGGSGGNNNNGRGGGEEEEEEEEEDPRNAQPTIDLHRSLTVAFIPPNARIHTAITDPFTCKTGHASYLGCDVLLTSDWGQGIAASSNTSSPPALNTSDLAKLQAISSTNSIPLSDIGSYDTAELIAQCRPRYHFAPTLYHLGLEHAVSSLPYANPPTMTSSRVERKFHPSRFIALGRVVDSKKVKELGKQEAKARKFVHALGLHPLMVMDQTELHREPEGGLVPCPYTDASYGMDARGGIGGMGGGGGGGMGMPPGIPAYGIPPPPPPPPPPGGPGAGNIGLSQAQTRRIMSEAAYGVDGHYGPTGTGVPTGNSFRWAGGGLGRGGGGGRGGRQRDPAQEEADRFAQQAAAADPNNKSLFIYGLNADTSGGKLVNATTILFVLSQFGCTNVRFPAPPRGPGERPKNFCFADFESHDEAVKCIESNPSGIGVRGVQLQMKWSRPSTKPRQLHPPGVPGVPPPPPPRKRKKITKEEAANSSTLFVKLPVSVPPESNAAALNAIAKWVQTVMEDQLNDDGSGGERITAETEPALKVDIRHARGDGIRDANYGFLEFASHAAAAMTMYGLTGDQDGGEVLTSELAKAKLGLDVRGALIQWGTETKSRENGGGDGERGPPTKKPRFKFPPADPRTDCWFCLSSPTCEKHLIFNVGQSVYLCMPKGPVNDHHALIVPVTHSPDESKIGIFSDASVAAEAEQAKVLLRKFAKEVLKKDLYIYERAIPTKGGYHPHINAIPIEPGLGTKLYGRMRSMATFDLKEVQNPDITMHAVLGDEEDWEGGYFYAEIPTGEDEAYKRMVCKLPKQQDGRKVPVPVQFGREVLSSILNKPEIAHWKECEVDKEMEEKLTVAYKELLDGFQHG